VNAGSYTFSEVTQAGYTASGFTCVGGNNSSPLTLGLNQSATCTITNDDLPSFVIVNKVSQGGFGTFTFSTTGFSLPNNNTITTTASGVLATTGQIAVLAFAPLTVGEPNPAAGFELLASACQVDQGAANLGATQVVNGVAITQGITITQPGTIVECTFDNTVVSGTTRTQGFWATHTGLSNAIWNGTSNLGSVPAVDKSLCGFQITAVATTEENILMGGFWSNISQLSGKGGKRSDIDQARMQMLQQYLAAVLNVATFHSNTEAFLAAARAAYCGTDLDAIKAQIGILGNYNQSGDAGLFDPGVSATAQASKSQADIDAWDIPQFPGLSDEDAGASPILTLNKSVSGAGTATPANFTLTATCQAGSGCSTALSGVGPTVGPTAKLSGIYNLTDVGAAVNNANNYLKGTWSCTGTGNFFLITGPAGTRTATLAAGKGATVSCSITNTAP